MDKTKSKLAAFFDNDDEDSSFPQKEIDDQKRILYTQGTARKSKREKEKEAAEAKRKEEEENAARAYAEFVDAFEGESAERRKAGSAFVKAGESSSAYPPSTAAKVRQPMRGFDDDLVPASPPPALPKPKGKRAMDAFLEEIKRDQMDRESRLSRHSATQGRSVTSIAAYEGQSGSRDRGDTETSNVFVANLPPHVNEQTLGNFFARMGPVGSVKIMWPRGDATIGPGADMTGMRRSKNSGLSGFVSFMKRKDAEAALRELDGFDWGGSILRVGWSKAVPIAAKAQYVVKKSSSRSRSRSRSPKAHHSHIHDRRRSPSRSPSRENHRSRGYHHARSRSRDRRSHSHSRRRSRSRSRRYDSRSRSPRRDRSRSPMMTLGLDDEDISDAFIRTVAGEVHGHDAEYEESLRERERANPKYAFLRKDHRRHKFYKLLLGQQGIGPEFEDEGYNSVYSTDSAEDSERERVRKTELGKLARKRFEAMLRAMSGRRGEVGRCMAFALEHAEAASEVTDIIIASLVVDGTAVPRKVARLHLICDILHNSAAPLPMAWKYRQEFQSRLGLVFDHLSTIYHSFPGRITAETFKKQILAVVDIWEDWIVFSPEFTMELRGRLEGSMLKHEEAPQEELAVTEAKEPSPAFTSKFKASVFKPAVEVASTEITPIANDEDGEPMDLSGSDVDGEPADDVDGEPFDDLDGEPMDDVDGEPMADDIDGEPLTTGEDIDGEPMEDDIDGAPVDV